MNITDLWTIRLKVLEDELAAGLLNDLSPVALAPVWAEIIKIRKRVAKPEQPDVHITEIPPEMQRHPALQALKEQFRRERRC